MFTRSSRPFDYRPLLRFGSVGLANTALGCAIVVAALGLGYGDILANLLGYAAGFVLGFVLNNRWTFNGAVRFEGATVLKYAATFVAAYTTNLAIVMSARAVGVLDNPLTHLAGLGAYVIVFYLGCARFVFAPRERARRQDLSGSVRSLLRARWPELAALLLWLNAFLYLRNIPVSHDVVWQMWIARQLLGGARLYGEILELNPPLWFWMALPVEWAAQALAIPPDRAIVATVFLLIGASLVVLAALLAHEKPGLRAVLLTTALAALVLIPIPDFAQREHLCLIGTVPYLVLAAGRADRRTIRWPAATATGLVAAMGFALKHYFLIVPGLLELWLLYRLRSEWTPFRPETVVLFAVAVCYAIAVAVFSPEFLTAIVPMINRAYDGYEVPFLRQVTKRWVVVWVLAALVLWPQRKAASSLTVAAGIATVAFCLSYLAQQKGWRYHALPCTAAMFFVIATLLPMQRRARAKWVKLPFLALVAVMTLLPSVVVGPYANDRAPHIRELLKGIDPGRPVMMLTGNPSGIWPMIEEENLKWPSRHFAFWMVHAIFAYRNEHGALSPELGELADAVRSQTVHDLTCNPPDLILVDDFRTSKSPGLDIVRFFEESDDFKRLFAHYTEVRTIAAYTSYRKREDWRPDPPTRCRTIH